ncbi:MAG TPA: HAMP domain-containing sensor histidine kinase [Anaerolineae bacterium]|nr:HAMP domain-containing sensor histidine kinase [Anaerolineae bacterium]
MNDAAASQYAPQANLISLVGQGLALLCWTAMVALSVAAWRRRRGNDFSDLLIAGGLWLAARLGTSAAGLPQSGQPGAGWLMLALDLGGLVLLAWPFLAPPLPFVWADRLAGIGLSAVALGCGISVWQWVRGTLGLPSTPQVTITWAYSTLALAGLAALHLLHRPAHRWAWGLTGAGALLLGTGGLLFPMPIAPRTYSSALSPVLTAFAATLAAGWLNWLEHAPRKPELATPSNPDEYAEVYHAPQTVPQLLATSISLFAATDLTQLLKATVAALSDVLEVRLAALLLAESVTDCTQRMGRMTRMSTSVATSLASVRPVRDEPRSAGLTGQADSTGSPRLRLAARWPQANADEADEAGEYTREYIRATGARDARGPEPFPALPPNLSPLLTDAFTRGHTIQLCRKSDGQQLEALKTILGARPEAALVLPLWPPPLAEGLSETRAAAGRGLLVPYALSPRPGGVLVLGYDGTALDADQNQRCRIVADQVAIGTDHVRLRTRVEQQSRALAHLARRQAQGNGQPALANLQECNRQLAEEIQQLQDLDRLKSQFIAHMSHELRAPLNSIMGFSGIMLKGIDGPLTDTQHQDVEAIHDSSKHLLRLIIDMLDVADGYIRATMGRVSTPDIRAGISRSQVSEDKTTMGRVSTPDIRAESSRMDLTVSTVDLEEMVKSAVTIAAPLIGDKPIEIAQALAPDLPPIRADKTRLRQVLINLLTNAIKYTERGRVSVSASRENDLVVIRVADTGIGIPPKHLETIFEESGRLDNPSTHKVEGLGLGLSISRQLVEAQGGRMWVESHVGVGSTFYVSLPIEGPPSNVASHKTTRDKLEAALAHWQ